jgi:hypothetical protein
MCTIRGKEADAVRVFLTDLYHHRDVKKKFRDVRDSLGRVYLLRLMRRLPLEKDERRYLREVIAGS